MVYNKKIRKKIKTNKNILKVVMGWKVKSTLIILILLSIFLGFYTALAVWYITHKHISDSLYISIIIGLIVSILYFLWCNKEGTEKNDIQNDDTQNLK